MDGDGALIPLGAMGPPLGFTGRPSGMGRIPFTLRRWVSFR